MLVAAFLCVVRVKRCFEKIDLDESGSITQHEFFTCLDLADIPFTRQLCNAVSRREKRGGSAVLVHESLCPLKVFVCRVCLG